MTSDEQKDEFEKLCARAKRNGLLRVAYPDNGIAIVALPPPAPPAAPLVAVQSAPPPAPVLTPATGV